MSGPSDTRGCELSSLHDALGKSIRSLYYRLLDALVMADGYEDEAVKVEAALKRFRKGLAKARDAYNFSVELVKEGKKEEEKP